MAEEINFNKNESFFDIQRNRDPQRGVQMTFCATCRKCPSINIHEDVENVILGGKEEGYSVWKKEQFAQFAEEIKKGTFDKFL